MAKVTRDYQHQDGKVIHPDNLLVSTTTPPYLISKIPHYEKKYLAFYGISNTRGPPARCLGGFSDLAKAKEACERHIASIPVRAAG